MRELATFVNVAKDMILWPHSLLDCLQQLDTASTTSTFAQVPMANGGSMGHKYINTTGDLVPLVLTWLTTL